MSKIIYANLETMSVTVQPHTYTGVQDTGRGLAVRLLAEANQLVGGQGSTLVIAPGLLSGTFAPSTCRITMAGRSHLSPTMLLANTGGPMAQKLGSMDIAALVITGSYRPHRTTIVHLGSEGVSVDAVPELRGQDVSTTIDWVRGHCGPESAIVGIGSAGEHLLPLASTFSTYPAGGKPVYHVGRNKMGHVLGAMGLKAVVVSTKANFTTPVAADADLRQYSKQLARLIVDHPVCGGALPAYGSITLIKMMKLGQQFATELSGRDRDDRPVVTNTGLNRNCAPGCVIGCLNRHAADAKEAYSSPAESEVVAACEELLGVHDRAYAKRLNIACYELGIDSLEFLASAAQLLRAEEQSATPEAVETLLDEVSRLTTRGRVVAGATSGIAALYPDQPSVQAMVTRPSTDEAARFTVSMPHKAPACADLSDMDYLYAYMLGTGNLGLCLFTSFAVLDHAEGQEILAKVVTAKTGVPTTAADIIRAGQQGLEATLKAEADLRRHTSASPIPEFVKVLYRYFQRA